MENEEKIETPVEEANVAPETPVENTDQPAAE